jgi:hypothetical protein
MSAGIHLKGTSLQYKNLLVVIKQTAFEEYSQVRETVNDKMFRTTHVLPRCRQL